MRSPLLTGTLPALQLVLMVRSRPLHSNRVYDDADAITRLHRLPDAVVSEPS